MSQMTPDEFASLITLTVAAIFMVGFIAIVLWLHRYGNRAYDPRPRAD